MYRSKRADKKHLLARIKIAIAFVLVAVGCGIFVGYSRGVGENADVPVFAEENFTYESQALQEPIITEIYDVTSYFYEEARAGGNLENSASETTVPETTVPEKTDEEEIYDDTSDCEQYVPIFFEPRKISLTFDDGPGYFTNYLLDILDEHGGRVTFCVIGDMIEDGADTIIRAFEAGHEIVGHSWDHRNLGRASVDIVTYQILQTSALLYEITGEPPPPLFRVPFGHNTRRITQAAYETGYGLLNWSMDPQDWHYRCEYHLYEYITENARHGAIIVLHDVHESTVYAMAAVIPSLMAVGFELVTASEIIYYVYGGIEPGFEYTGLRR